MRVEERAPWNLTQDELEQCKKLTLPHGLMKHELRDVVQRREGRVFFVRDGNKILGWALVSPRYDSPRGLQVMFFVHPEHRRLGYGSQMLRIIRRRYKKVATYSHTEGAAKFFLSKKGQP